MHAKEAEKALDGFKEFVAWQARGIDICEILRQFLSTCSILSSFSGSNTMACTADIRNEG